MESKKRIFFSLIILSFSAVPFKVLASETGPSIRQESDETLIKQRAKKKLYPGGVDEEALKVQSQTPIITRKMGPTEEVEVSQPASSEND